MGKFILIDFKKREEHAALQKLVPTIGMKMDQWINNYDAAGETPPNEEEAKELENTKINELLIEFDTKAEQLWRVKDEHASKRMIVEVDLNKRKGRLFRKYADEVDALKGQAADTMQYCIDNLTSFEYNLSNDVIPTSEDDLERIFMEFLKQMDEYVESTFPDGVAGMDSFDDVLPDGLPSYTKFKESVTSKLHDEYKTKNKDAIPGAIVKVKSSSSDMFKDVINKAINDAIDGIVTDLSDDTLPYLDDDAMQSLRDELITAAKEYGSSRIEE